MPASPPRPALRYVQGADGDVDLGRFPDFLIVGPQRTGTTWLHAHLRFHPDIFLSEPKELLFFNRLATPDHPKFKSNELRWYLQFFRDPPWRWALKSAVCLWRYRQAYRPRVRGEASASYAALPAEIIAEITALKPDVKVILMIRNPVDRTWSHAKKDLARNRQRPLTSVSIEELHDFFTDPYQRQCARYVDNIDHWATHLRPGNLLLAFFEDVRARPEELLLTVMQFLGVRADQRYIDADVRASVNPTEATMIPEEARRQLMDLFAPDLDKLRQRFGITWPLRDHPLVIRLP